ncbi:MAG: hypothetical protein ABI780_11475 [Ardenticatenales bacterium]
MIVAIALVGPSAIHAELVAAQSPTSPPLAAAPVAPIGQLGGATRAIAPSADGRTLWIGYGPRLARVDVSNRAAPRLVAVSALLPAVVNAIALDVAAARIVVAAGDTLYVFAAGDVVAGVEAAPTARIAVADGASGDEVRELAVARGVAYARTDDGIERRGGTRQNTPRVWAVPLDGATSPGATQRPVLTEGWYATDVLVAGGRLYVASADRPLDGWMDEAHPGRLWVFDLAHPDAPRLLGVLDGAAWAARLASPAAAGGAAHVFGSGDGVVGIDLTDIARPREVLRAAPNEDWGRRRLRSAEARLAATRSGGVVSGYTYGIGGEGAIGDVGSGVSIGASLFFKTSVAGGFAAMGEMIYASETAGRLTVAERTAAGAIVTRGQLDLLGGATGVSADPSRPGQLVAAVSRGGLAVIDAADPHRLALGAYDLDGSRRDDVDADGGIVVATYGGEGDVVDHRPDIYSIDRTGRLSRTAQLSRFGFLDSGRARQGSALYLSGTAADFDFNDHGVSVIDLTNPAAPVTRAVLGTLNKVRGIAAADGRLVVPYVVDPDPRGGLSRVELDVYDAANPLQPRLLRHLDAGLPTTDSYRAPQIALAGRWALIYSASPPPAPEETYRVAAIDLESPSPEPHLWPPELASSVFRVRGGFALTHAGCDLNRSTCRIHMIRVTTPATPTLATVLSVPATLYNDRPSLADAQDGTVYVAAGAAGLYAFRPPVAWSPAAVPPTPTADPALSPTPAPTATPTPARLASPGVAPTAGATVRVLPTPAGGWAVYVPVAWGRGG